MLLVLQWGEPVNQIRLRSLLAAVLSTLSCLVGSPGYVLGFCFTRQQPLCTDCMSGTPVHQIMCSLDLEGDLREGLEPGLSLLRALASCRRVGFSGFRVLSTASEPSANQDMN